MRLTSVFCGLLLAAALVLAGAQPGAARTKLEGNWTAIEAQRDGKGAADVVGHRLSFTGSRFEIRSKDGKILFAGTFRTDPDAKPPAIDFEHTEGELKGKAWKGIYAQSGGRLTIVDNAPDVTKPRPSAFVAKSGSGYVLIVFQRAR